MPTPCEFWDTRFTPPRLPAWGIGAICLRPGINLDTHTDDIVNLAETENLANFTLVGWSYGGMVISNVLARIPEKISSVVYLDAFAPERGRSMLSYANRLSSIEDAIQLAIEGKDFAALSVASMGVSDQAIVDYATARVSPHPIMTTLQASRALERRPDIPHTYVLAGRYTKQSQAFVPFYKAFADDKQCDAIILDTGHVMMLTDVALTAETLANTRT